MTVILAVTMIGALCSCSNGISEGSINSNIESSISVSEWRYTDIEWCDNLKLAIPTYTSTSMHYDMVKYTCEWGNGEVDIYTLPLTNYIYGGGGGGKDFDSVTVANEEEAFDKGIMAFTMNIMGGVDEDKRSYEVKRTEISSMKFNDIDVSKIIFTMGGTEYEAYLHMSSISGEDGMIIVEKSKSEVLDTMMETLSTID